MTYQTGEIVRSTDYNTLATNVNDLFWTSGAVYGGRDVGYGQSPITVVAPGRLIGASEWTTLYNALRDTATHQGTTLTPPMPANPVSGGTITAYATSPDLNSITDQLQTNRRNSATNGTAITQLVVNSASWNGTLVANATVAISNSARYFFNCGGTISVSASFTPSFASSLNSSWQTLCSNMGTVTYASSNLGQTIAGTNLSGVTKVGGGGNSPTITNNGYNNGVGSLIQTSATAGFTNNLIAVTFTPNGNSIAVRVRFVDQTTNSSATNAVVGTLTLTVTATPAATTGSFLNTWGTTTVTGAFNPPIVINPTALTVNYGVTTSQQLTASGGTAPYTWSVIAGSLPTGLSLSSQGTVTGSTTQPPGSYPCEIQALDADGNYGRTLLTTNVSLLVNYLVIAGGGGGGSKRGGGGGAGGMLEGQFPMSGSYSITIGSGGAGGAGEPNWGADGGSTTLSGTGLTVTTTGGGGGTGTYYGGNGRNGGSGSGANGNNGGRGYGGVGIPGQGNNGGDALSGYGGSGGGGAGARGGDKTTSSGGGGAGGAGRASSITGSSVYYAGGGSGGASYGAASTPGGIGGGGAGSGGGATYYGGGGGGGFDNPGAHGGSGYQGIVIISYPASTRQATGGAVTVYNTPSGPVWVHTFTGSGTLTFPF